MKKLLLAAVTAGVFCGVTIASAADLSVRNLSSPPPVSGMSYDWSGVYAGLNGGWGSARHCWGRTNGATNNILSPTQSAVPEGCPDTTGGTIGGQVGYRLQMTPFVFGAEAQGNWADFKGSKGTRLLANAGIVNSSRDESFVLLTGQVGFAWNNALLYIKGGAAVTNSRYSGRFTGVSLDAVNDTRWGAALGAGLEYGFASNWSVGLEYDHLFMPDRSKTLISTIGLADAIGFASRRDRISQDIDLITARISYHFGGSAFPVH